MAQKNATPTRDQQAILKKNGLIPVEWVVIRDLNRSMIIRNWITKEIKMIDK